MTTYKFYRAQVTGAGYMPEGDCLGILHLDEERKPTWSEMNPDFEKICLPWFKSTVRMGVYDNPDPLVPYSEEALEHLCKHQLPSQGYVMVKIGTPPKLPQAFTTTHGMYSPPPGIFKRK